MTDWVLSTLWYGSALVGLVGLLATIKPVRWLRVRSRRHALMVVAVSVAAMFVNALIAPSPQRPSTAAPALALDRIAPTYDFSEFHQRTVDAPLAHVLVATKQVTASEIPLFQAFTAIRRFGRKGPESILNAPEHLPILEVATRTTFWLLADTDREIVFASIVVAPRGFRVPSQPDAEWFTRLADPGVVKAVMNFAFYEDGLGTRVTTETRVMGTDAASVRRFTPYWRTIFPGSWILRVTWLRAIAARAERTQ
jgi:hypothetical protein